MYAPLALKLLISCESLAVAKETPSQDEKGDLVQNLLEGFV